MVAWELSIKSKGKITKEFLDVSAPTTVLHDMHSMDTSNQFPPIASLLRHLQKGKNDLDTILGMLIRTNFIRKTPRPSIPNYLRFYI